MALLTAALVALATLTAGPASMVCYVHPVPDRIDAAFAAPPCTWCPGHRGVTYATRAGAVVRAAAPGVVSFAGPVAGRWWVTVLHADGLRTSYGPLARVSVLRGQQVDQSSRLGTTLARLHVGLRRGAQYLDPVAWFRRLRPVVRLLAPDAPAPAAACGNDRPAPARSPAGPGDRFGIR